MLQAGDALYQAYIAGVSAQVQLLTRFWFCFGFFFSLCFASRSAIRKAHTDFRVQLVEGLQVSALNAAPPDPSCQKLGRLLQPDRNTVLSDHLKTSCRQLAVRGAGSTPGTQHIQAWPLAMKSFAITCYGSRYFSRQQKKSIGRTGMQKTARPSLGCLSCRYELPALRTAYQLWTTTVDSNIDLVFQHCTYETWLQHRKKHLLLLRIITLSPAHRGMQTRLNSLPRQQNCNKYNAANSLHASTTKKGRVCIFTMHSAEKRTYLERPTAHDRVPGSCPSGEPLAPSWHKRIMASQLVWRGGRASNFVMQSHCLPWKMFHIFLAEISILW